MAAIVNFRSVSIDKTVGHGGAIARLSCLFTLRWGSRHRLDRLVEPEGFAGRPGGSWFSLPESASSASIALTPNIRFVQQYAHGARQPLWDSRQLGGYVRLVFTNPAWWMGLHRTNVILLPLNTTDGYRRGAAALAVFRGAACSLPRVRSRSTSPPSVQHRHERSRCDGRRHKRRRLGIHAGERPRRRRGYQ